MATGEGILLTGGTGLLGRYLLRELLRTGHRVVVLGRADQRDSAEERYRAITERFRSTIGTSFAAPVILEGDLREPGLGLSDTDCNWLGRNCHRVIHAAARVSFEATPGGEPHETNTAGTARLAAVCLRAGIEDVHHVSTAFVCGHHPGPVLEMAGKPGEFHNEYERSKWDAETLLRDQPKLRTTIYRPSVIVGDSRTGYTSCYHGLYRFLELAARLAKPGSRGNRPGFTLRLPFTGDELRDLVPVDWVARAILSVVHRPHWHGKTFHLTSSRPISVRDIKSVAEQELQLAGLELTGALPPEELTPTERAYRDGIKSYWPYLGSDPVFDRRNTLAALADLPAPVIDAPALARLIRFAVTDNWGRREEPARDRIDCRDYIENFFPTAMANTFLADLGISVTLGFEIHGTGGGHWVSRFVRGQVVEVTRGGHVPAEVTYRMDVKTFAAVVSGKELAHVAFFDRRIEILGRIEMGLKLAVLFGRFVQETPYPPAMEARNAVAR